MLASPLGAVPLEQRAAEATQLAERERTAARELVDEIASYLAADRHGQRATRVRWAQLTHRLNVTFPDVHER